MWKYFKIRLEPQWYLGYQWVGYPSATLSIFIIPFIGVHIETGYIRHAWGCDFCYGDRKLSHRVLAILSGKPYEHKGCFPWDRK